jgi:hypothetical protein
MGLARQESDEPACYSDQAPANKYLRDNTTTLRTCDHMIMFCRPCKKRIILVGYKCMRDGLGEVIRLRLSMFPFCGISYGCPIHGKTLMVHPNRECNTPR